MPHTPNVVTCDIFLFIAYLLARKYHNNLLFLLFFYKQYILGQPQDAAMILAKLSAATTFINAVVSVILVAIIYNSIRPILKKSGLLLPV